MPDVNQELQFLFSNPSESLTLEFKAWIDPNTPEGRAKIAKGCLALRNSDGGRFIVGIRDNGLPDTANAPPNARAAFHVDVVQGIVSAFLLVRTFSRRRRITRTRRTTVPGHHGPGGRQNSSRGEEIVAKFRQQMRLD